MRRSKGPKAQLAWGTWRFTSSALPHFVTFDIGLCRRCVSRNVPADLRAPGCLRHPWWCLWIAGWIGPSPPSEITAGLAFGGPERLPGRMRRKGGGQVAPGIRSGSPSGATPSTEDALPRGWGRLFERRSYQGIKLPARSGRQPGTVRRRVGGRRTRRSGARRAYDRPRPSDRSAIKGGRAVGASTRGTTAAEPGTRGPSRGRSLPCWR